MQKHAKGQSVDIEKFQRNEVSHKWEGNGMAVLLISLIHILSL